MSKMDDDTLLSHLEVLERQAVGWYTGQIVQDQSTAMDYYLQKPFGTEEEGRSQVVSSDVWDVVEGMTPMILRPFVASFLVDSPGIGPANHRTCATFSVKGKRVNPLTC